MADKSQEPTQTTPTGVEIPVPTREQFMRDLRKVAPPVQPPEGQDERDNDS